MNDFFVKLKAKILEGIYNNFENNYDFYRFKAQRNSRSFKDLFREKLIYPNYIAKWRVEKIFSNSFDVLLGNIQSLGQLYEDLDDEESKELLVELMAYRILGAKHIKLRTNSNVFWEGVKKAEELIQEKDVFIKIPLLNWVLKKHYLKNIGYDSTIFFTSLGVAVDFILEQYAYKATKKIIQAEKDDYVIDAGACWGDTAIYFANKVGFLGKVFSFEFVPSNIEIWSQNISLNPNLAERIELISKPLWDETGKSVYYQDCGPASRIKFEDFEEATGRSQTIKIDDFVKEKNITKIDYIKMDIEGAEFFALKGAKETIQKFKPKLAIAIYHSLDDFVQIPAWIKDLNLGYKLYLGHYTIHQEETVLFAIVE